MNAKPKRRSLQFSLRGLLLLMVVIAVPVGWAAYKVRQRRNAVAALEKTGCAIEYDLYGNVPPDFVQRLRTWLGDEKTKPVIFVDCSKSQISDAELTDLQALDTIRTLVLNARRLRDVAESGITGRRRFSELAGGVSSGWIARLRSNRHAPANIGQHPEALCRTHRPTHT